MNIFWNCTLTKSSLYSEILTSQTLVFFNFGSSNQNLFPSPQSNTVSDKFTPDFSNQVSLHWRFEKPEGSKLPGGVDILLVASCYRKWDKLWPDQGCLALILRRLHCYLTRSIADVHVVLTVF